MKFLNWFYLCFFCLLLIISVSVNIKGTIKHYTEFYYQTDGKERLENNSFYQVFKFVNHKSVSTIMTYTGLDTGFGFFAPNVASEYITEFHVFDKDSLLLSTQYFPTLKKESRLRLSSAYGDFQEYLEEKPDSLKLKKCDILLKGLSLKVLSEHEQGSFVSSRVYLYHHPLLSQLKANPKMEAIMKPLKHQTYTNDETWDGY